LFLIASLIKNIQKGKNLIKKLIRDFVLFSGVVSLIFYFVSCSNDSTTVITPTVDANSINGTISFVDTTNILTDTTAGYYSVSAYANWPPAASPTSTVKIVPVKSGTKYSANYKFTGMANGSYAITAAYIKIPYVPGSSVLGLGLYNSTAGCDDTSHLAGCIYSTSIPKATITSNAGVSGINFKSFADTTKKIYKF
jgi:hypothetical protein